MATLFINCNPDNISLGILAECKDAEKVEMLGRYEHPEHLGSADWMISVFALTFKGGTVYAVSTNGDPVWEDNDPQAFADLLEEYGVEL